MTDKKDHKGNEIDLAKIDILYRTNYLAGDECTYIQWADKFQKWDKMNDYEKLEYFQNRLKYYEIHLQELPEYPLMKNGTLFFEELLIFLENTTDLISPMEISEKSNFLFRFRNLCYCEKILIARQPSLQTVRTHVPLKLLKSLKENVSDHDRQENNIDILFQLYQRMIEEYLILFPELNEIHL